MEPIGAEGLPAEGGNSVDAVVLRDPLVKRTFLKTACGVDDEDLLEAIWELQVRWDDGRLGAAECWEDADREALLKRLAWVHLKPWQLRKGPSAGG